jgi:cytochrome c-type biogenesis protein CcmI
MTGGLILSLLVGIVALTFVLVPLFRKDAAEAEALAAATSETRDLQSRKEMLLSSLRDLEDDRSTGKIDERDYEKLKGQLESQAVEVMKRLDALDAPSAGAPGTPSPSSPGSH